jgi:uncharacterized LabA/DUF88 family protein
MAPIQSVSYLFIDGGYLDCILEKFSKLFFNKETIDFDYRKLKSSYKRAFYYNSLPGKKSDETPEEYDIRSKIQNEKFKNIGRLPGYHFREGVVRRESKKNTQKKVDILMAVDMLSHTISHNMDSVSLLTGDLDFQPVLDALVQAGMYTRLIYLPENTSDELISSADESYPINLSSFLYWLSESFLNKYPIPEILHQINPEPIKGATLIKNGVYMETKEAYLYKRVDGKFVADLEQEKGEPSRRFIIHKDPEFIQNYIISCYGAISWK